MKKYTEQNKSAWEYSAYDFWVSQSGVPSENAKKMLEDPRAKLKKYSKYFDDVQGIKIANICGSCGKKAIPLSLLGALVTVFDISIENKKYASETAKAADTHIEYVVGDVLDMDMSTFGEYFDIVFMEGGILHYFHDLDQFMHIMNGILKKDGKLICSDFHPINKVMDTLELGIQTTDYFSTDIIECEMAHAKFYNDEKRRKIPKCYLRRYTFSEVINSIIAGGFFIKRVEEHPAWTNEKLPGEFTVLADKI